MSSGNGHPPDKPFEAMTLSDDDAQASAQIAAAWELGKIVKFIVPFGPNNQSRAFVGNYEKKQ